MEDVPPLYFVNDMDYITIKGGRMVPMQEAGAAIFPITDQTGQFE
jgi:hypothetical protein